MSSGPCGSVNIYSIMRFRVPSSRQRSRRRIFGRFTQARRGYHVVSLAEIATAASRGDSYHGQNARRQVMIQANPFWPAGQAWSIQAYTRWTNIVRLRADLACFVFVFDKR